MSGNRTRGVCVTGRNVTNYTNTDLFLFQNLKRCIRPRMFEFQRERCCNRGNVSSFDHTMVDTPHPIRTAKLSTIGPNQYCGGGPRGNLGCRMFFFGEFFHIFFVAKFFCFTHFFFSQNLRLCGLFCFEFSPTNSAFHWFFRLKIQRMQNAPPNQEKKKREKKQTGKPRLNLTRSLQQGNSR